MKNAVPICVAGLAMILLGACAAPGPEAQPAAKAQAESQPVRQNRKDDDCEETTGSRFKRCPGGSSGPGMVTGGAVAPGTVIAPPSSKSN